MGRLTKAIITATLTVALIAAFAAATVSVNTPTGPLFIGAQYFIRWTITGSAPTTLGIITIHNTDNNNVTTIDSNVNFTANSNSLPWTVNVVAGTYYFGINDGSGENDSGQFQVIDRGSGSTGTAPAPSGNTPAPTPQGTTNAPAPGTTAAPAGTTNTGSNPTPAPAATTKNGASTMRSNLLGLFVGLGVVASVMIQLF